MQKITAKLERLIKNFLQNCTTKQSDILADMIQRDLNIWESIPGSGHNHQAWQGGFLDHLLIMQFICQKWKTSGIFPSPDMNWRTVHFGIILHDFDKILRYNNGITGISAFQQDWANYDKMRNSARINHVEFIQKLLLKYYSYELSEQEMNALQFVHGEGDSYSGNARTMLPETALLHSLDTLSARVYFNHYVTIQPNGAMRLELHS